MTEDYETWADMFPDGRHIFYEGNDPIGFVAEIKARFNFDPSLDPEWGRLIPASKGGGPGYEDIDNKPKRAIPAFTSYSFHCPANILDAIYTEYPMGS